MTTIPKIRRYARGDTINVQAQRVWLILVALVQGQRLLGQGGRSAPTITYGELAHWLGYPYEAGILISRQLWMVGEYCKLNGLPCLNTVVVNADTGECGKGVVVRRDAAAKRELTPKEERRDVWKQNWFEVGVPSTGTFRKVWASKKRKG